MGNKIPAEATATVEATVTVTIPSFVADGVSGSGAIRELTFSGGAPPTDGSLAMAFIVINGNTGLSYVGGHYQRLAYWINAGGGGVAKVSGGSGFDFVHVPAWTFIADANVTT